MSDYSQINLKRFELSSPTLNLSLSVTSVAFIYDVPLSITSQDDLSSLILSKKLWLLPPGLCRLEVCVKLDDCDSTWREEQEGFFDFIADAICDSFLWWQLGLKVEILDVQYHGEGDNTPNLYFSIEKPDMSSSLLSPPHTKTAHLKGLECVLRFKPSTYLEASDVNEDQRGSDISLPSPKPTSTPDLIEAWGNVAYLVESALCITFGTRQRIQGLRISELEKAPTLLDLAPAIWNSHYLKSAVSYTKNFPVISNILASSLNGQSPGLRRKGAEILKDNAGASIDPYQELERSIKQLESFIQRMLWDLLQATLKPTIGTKKRTKKGPSPDAELDNQDYEVEGIIFDEEIADQYYDWPDGGYYAYADLPLPSSQSHHDYQDVASYNTDFEFAWHQDNQALRAPVFENEIGISYYEVDVGDGQLFKPYIERGGSDQYMIQDHMLMSEDIYDENDDIYDHKYGYASLMEQGSGAYELEATTASRWEEQDEDNIDERAVENALDPEVDEEL
ncbi:hypothetical protein O1611_g498 [Lasiodiplodia mahajangana]|uniref:Uncharacterized protein n=1 Tax=Lasiodiplodia mahajangana TaxID=1108764 RepID=A0ACC2K0F8_9PEZI|nr:hypothetical protein O1611_g498 [Lasiodiplodia mahajangana]